jgi:hypothetical protein
MSPLDAAKFFREKADAYLDITGFASDERNVGGCMSYSRKTKLEPNSSSG